jgi:large subunit ribosomal protein L25
MSVQFQINAENRAAKGTTASRRYRHGGKIPAVIYGAGKDNVALLLDHNEMRHNLEVEAFHSAIIDIKTDQGMEKAILRDVQMHPQRPLIMHVDFQRVSATEKLHMSVPLHFAGEDEAPGVRLEAGIMTHLVNDVEIECLPADLPEYLEVDVSSLALNESAKLSDIKVPEGVILLALAHGGEDQTVAAVAMPKAAPVEEEIEIEGEEIEAEATAEETEEDKED